MHSEELVRLNGCAPQPGPCVGPPSPLPAPASAQPSGRGLLPAIKYSPFLWPGWPQAPSLSRKEAQEGGLLQDWPAELQT